MAVILAAGMHGIDAKIDPGKRLDIDMYAEGHKVKGAKKLPLNLLDALRKFEQGQVSAAMRLGAEFSDAYLKLKTNEWNQYCRASDPVGAGNDARLLSEPSSPLAESSRRVYSSWG